MRFIRLLFLLAMTANCMQVMADTTSIIGTPAPLFRLPNQNTATPLQYTIADQFSPDSQHAVIVSFFATWCEPCRKELPFLQHYADSLRENGLRLVTVCMDSTYGAKQEKMVADMQLSCPVIHDKFGIVAQRYEFAKALPYTVFVARNGFVRDVSIGYDQTKQTMLQQYIQRILETH
jgi:thiol-disulfide isomerase/thioredoxin